MELVLTVLVGLVVALIAKWIWDRYNIQQTWQRRGIPGPKSASLLFGNLGEIGKKGTFPTFEEWTKKYGKVFGYYQSCTPVLVSADPDMAREVFIKQFDNFEERHIAVDNTKYPLNHLADQGGEQWKKVRGLSSPTFSAKRMKQMSPLVHKSIDKLMDLLTKRAEKGNAFNIADDVKMLTLDVIASTVFSLDTDVFAQEGNNVFLQKMKELFVTLNPKTAPAKFRIKTMTHVVLPGFVKFVRQFNPYAFKPPFLWFFDLAKKMINDRLDTGEHRADYLQHMLAHGTHRMSGNTSGTESDLSDNEMSNELRRDAKKKELTMAEMQGQITVFLIAGYETTATTLAYMCYYLALYPDVQSKLQAEIDEHFPDSNKPVNYETVQGLSYLDMAFCETSRLGSIAQIAATRTCNTDTDVCGYKVPKGAKVCFNMIQIHHDPKLWGPEPVDEFVPERFTKERKGSRHPMAYMPFGGGPRNCIGMRFAIMEAKMAMINMLQRFTIVKCAETQVPLVVAQNGVHGPTEGVFIKLIKRE